MAQCRRQGTRLHTFGSKMERAREREWEGEKERAKERTVCPEGMGGRLHWGDFVCSVTWKDVFFFNVLVGHANILEREKERERERERGEEVLRGLLVSQRMS